MPVSGLLRAEQALADVLREMMAQRGCGILYVPHRVDEVRSLVDRILVMRDGRLVFQQENSVATEDTLMSAGIGASEPSGSGRRAATSA